MPTTEKSVDGMYEQLTEFIRHISNPYLKSLLEYFFVNDQEFIKKIPVTFCSENGTPRIFGRTAGTYVERTSDVRIFCRIIWNFKQRSSVDSGNVPMTSEKQGNFRHFRTMIIQMRTVDRAYCDRSGNARRGNQDNTGFSGSPCK